jgi:hypothetical protein
MSDGRPPEAVKRLIEALQPVADAQERVEACRQHHNGERPHGSLENLTPNEYADKAAMRSPHGGSRDNPGGLTTTQEARAVLPRAG